MKYMVFILLATGLFADTKIWQGVIKAREGAPKILEIAAEDTLQLQAGTSVKICEECQLKVAGTLLVLGTEEEPVLWQGGSVHIEKRGKAFVSALNFQSDSGAVVVENQGSWTGFGNDLRSHKTAVIQNGGRLVLAQSALKGGVVDFYQRAGEAQFEDLTFEGSELGVKGESGAFFYGEDLKFKEGVPWNFAQGNQAEIHNVEGNTRGGIGGVALTQDNYEEDKKKREWLRYQWGVHYFQREHEDVDAIQGFTAPLGLQFYPLDWLQWDLRAGYSGVGQESWNDISGRQPVSSTLWLLSPWNVDFGLFFQWGGAEVEWNEKTLLLLPYLIDESMRLPAVVSASENTLGGFLQSKLNVAKNQKLTVHFGLLQRIAKKEEALGAYSLGGVQWSGWWKPWSLLQGVSFFSAEGDVIEGSKSDAYWQARYQAKMVFEGKFSELELQSQWSLDKQAEKVGSLDTKWVYSLGSWGAGPRFDFLGVFTEGFAAIYGPGVTFFWEPVSVLRFEFDQKLQWIHQENVEETWQGLESKLMLTGGF